MLKEWQQTYREQRWFRCLTMISLILAGETVFLPAFHLGRYFKSSLLSVFRIDEFQLGQLGAIYGVFATVCYFLGGPLADKWSARRLLAISLLVTASGSLFMASVPGFQGLCWLFAFWGVSTILCFWAPLIKATREWAREDGQARAFGILDGGRGLASAMIASLAALAFATMVGDDPAQVAEYEPEAIRRLVLSYGAYCILAAAFVWLFVPEQENARTETKPPPAGHKVGAQRFKSVWIRLILVLRSPAIWLQAVVIIAAYSAFKMIDNYGLYAEDAFGLSKTESANLLASVSYVRVGAALAAGWVADKLLGVRATIQVCFGLLIVAYIVFLNMPLERDWAWLLTANMVVSCVGFFALRGIYFALLEDSGTPRQLTGTAVGVISFVGYTPEIFMGPLTGWFIREARAAGNVVQGYQTIFLILLILCGCGMAAAFALRFVHARQGKA